MDHSQIENYVLQLIRDSDSQKTAWNMEKFREGQPVTWNYIDGCMITALLSMSDITGDSRYYDFAESFISDFISDDGTIRTYNMEKFSLDDVNEGRVLFELYKKTGKEKYRLAAEKQREQLRRQPRTREGNFWHKKIYPDQVWLDGIYMAQPFLALYEKNFGTGDYSDTVRQIETVRKRMYDDSKHLYYHGYDAEKVMFWADPETGCSKNFWLRALGWFSVAMADLLEIIPDQEPKSRLLPIFRELIDGIKDYADPESGMYYQVVDQGGREGNYLETSGSCMIAYAMMKGARLGILPSEYAELGRKTFNGIVDRYLSFTDGRINLGGICLVAGLGPDNKRWRDGSYEYYLSEPVVENDAKGVAPFLLCYTEIMRLQDPNSGS